MRILLTVSLLAASGTACADQVPATTAPSPVVAARTIVAFGDSLTSGKGLKADQAYPAVLQRLVEAAGLPFHVANHGVSGDTTADGVRRVRAALVERPAVMILALGA